MNILQHLYDGASWGLLELESFGEAIIQQESGILESRDEFGNNMLHVACGGPISMRRRLLEGQNDHRRIAKLLLKNGINVPRLALESLGLLGRLARREKCLFFRGERSEPAGEHAAALLLPVRS